MVIRSEAILQRRLSPSRANLGRFLPCLFLADSKVVPSQISCDFSEMPFSFDFGGYRSRIRLETILH
ncbi:unnamed protein product [Linum trigynum]|uniref:Uncharacterized protein n=1 Tax=Linum trigynum TaxID=586398 RepID=A0AAV2C8L2_9ROSI